MYPLVAMYALAWGAHQTAEGATILDRLFTRSKQMHAFQTVTAFQPKLQH